MFLALLTSLPTGNSTLRMRVWRALKGSGCGVLRDGVYLLPVEAPGAAALADAEAEIKAAGGFAMTVQMDFKTPDQVRHVRKLFDRGEEYAALLARAGAARAALGRLGKRRAGTLVQRLRRSLAELAAIDFYPGQAQRQAEDAMSALEDDVGKLFSAGEPRSSKKRLRRLDTADYRNRVWVTRTDLWVDRLASIWLIRRFVDKKARFAWIDKPRSRPRGSLGFDFDGAEFTHVGGRVTFEVLVGSFGLDGDPALASIGHAVHFLDVGGIPVPDATGLETVLRGIKAKSGSDDETALEAGKVFDLFYAAYSKRITSGAN
jgi:hypothetical protein